MLTRAAVLTAAALALSYVESFIPVPFPVPGAKLGLANIVTLIALCTLGARNALGIAVARVCIAGFLFGSASSIIYALSGAVLSWAVMTLCRRRCSVVLTSVLGGIAHNAGQLMTACAVLKTGALVWSYGPTLFVLGTLTGLFTGLCAAQVLKRLDTRRRTETE